MTDEREKKRVETRLAILEAEVGIISCRVDGDEWRHSNFRRQVDARLRRLEKEVGVLTERYGTVDTPRSDTPKE